MIYIPFNEREPGRRVTVPIQAAPRAWLLPSSYKHYDGPRSLGR